MNKDICFYCKREFDVEDLRPYGPKNSFVCFECAFETEERKKETEKNFGIHADACLKENGTIIIGASCGPFVLKNKKDLN